jgi:predicted phage terminase large subunit-like protein
MTLKENELERIRRRSRKDLLLFTRYVWPKYIHGEHLDCLALALERIERGELRRLMVFMPPRHGKSALISQLFPCFFLGRNPTREVIQTGYGDDIASFHSYHARRIFTTQRFNELFPGVSRPLNAEEAARQAVHEWRTQAGGSYRASGIRAGISGRGAELIIIDDPVKNREEANSVAVRESVLQEYRGTLVTRLSPNGAIVLVMTRWHPDDLAGTLLKEMAGGGTQWEVINMPAINEDGKALWPERWPIEKIMEQKMALGSREFGALYMQNPRMMDNAIFRREWFEVVDAAPAQLEKVRYWDRAATKNKDSDWTSGVLMGRDRLNRYFVLHVNRFQGSPLAVETGIKNTASQDGVETMIGIEQDPGQAGIAEASYYVRALTGYNVRVFPVTKAKTIRATPFAAQAEAGNVKLVRGSWNEPYLSELENFAGLDEKNDQTDSSSGAFNVLSGQAGGPAALVDYHNARAPSVGMRNGRKLF